MRPLATFVCCLQEIKQWSDSNPTHLPIMVLVEAKDEEIPDPLDLGFAIPPPIDAALASGAHFISTDYPLPNLQFSDYQVSIPGDYITRCNPVNPGSCTEVSLLP